MCLTSTLNLEQIKGPVKGQAKEEVQVKELDAVEVAARARERIKVRRAMEKVQANAQFQPPAQAALLMAGACATHSMTPPSSATPRLARSCTHVEFVSLPTMPCTSAVGRAMLMWALRLQGLVDN